MAVYVDFAYLKYGKMRMSHMVADSREELISMADRIDVNRRWIQCPGTHREHFDICKSKLELAVKLGAIPTSTKEIARIIRNKRKGVAKAEGREGQDGKD